MKVWWGSLHFPLTACLWKIWNSHYNLKGKLTLLESDIFKLVCHRACSGSMVFATQYALPWPLAFIPIYIINVDESWSQSAFPGCVSETWMERFFLPNLMNRSFKRTFVGIHPPCLCCWTCRLHSCTYCRQQSGLHFFVITLLLAVFERRSWWISALILSCGLFQWEALLNLKSWIGIQSIHFK